MLLYNEDVLNILDQVYYRDRDPDFFAGFLNPEAPGSAYKLMETNPVYANELINNPPE
jgi:hypothetical protein